MKYKRVLLKLSGEALIGDDDSGISTQIIEQFTEEITEIHNKSVQIGIVIGGGNIFRGLAGVSSGFDRVTGDQMGMLATIINSLALSSALKKNGVKSKVFSAVEMQAIASRFHAPSVINEMKNGTVAIMAGGTGNPYFSTDTAAVLRALEIESDVLLKGTRVDGVYSDDPEKNPDAIKYESITFEDAWTKKLKVMDLTAFTMCQENNLPILVFNMNKKGQLTKIIENQKIGTLLHN